MAKRIEVAPAPKGRVIDKQAVALSFSRAAASYDAVANIQRWVIGRLLESMGPMQQVQKILDVGCGTGQLMMALQKQYQSPTVVGLDIAEGMTRAATQRTGLPAVCGDAEAMPLPDQAFDLLVSSFALQWCPDLERVFSEARRVLQPGGRFYFALPVSGTLDELRDCWAQVDSDNSHVNEFYHGDDLVTAARKAGFSHVSLRVQAQREYYPDLRAITSALKAMGAHNITQGRARQLTGKHKLKALVDAYEGYRTGKGLPLTWQVGFGVLEK
ncbi:MAG: malonyl-ACP O-methyltransferase BioC [Ketobacteraceae bacterium]|nr:malonyl-ACP O-methyltransferase BioC [Ketobacteraceae bacterium]